MGRIERWHHLITKKSWVYKLRIQNGQEFPKLTKIVVNLSSNNCIHDSKEILPLITALELITNKKPVSYRAKKSISAFKLRKGSLMGIKSTVRKKLMFEFFEILIFLVLPKVNNFKGFSLKKSRYNTSSNLGLLNLFGFPQISENSDKFHSKIGANISLVSTMAICLLLNSNQVPIIYKI